MTTKPHPSARWYYRADGQTRGPFTDHQLRELAATGQVSPKTLISRDAAKWQLAATASGLFPEPPLDREAQAPPSIASAPQPLREDPRLDALVSRLTKIEAHLNLIRQNTRLIALFFVILYSLAIGSVVLVVLLFILMLLIGSLAH